MTPALAAFLNEKKEGAFRGFVRPAAGKGVAILAQRMFSPPTPADVDGVHRRGLICDQWKAPGRLRRRRGNHPGVARSFTAVLTSSGRLPACSFCLSWELTLTTVL
jgi:hypothetical protein